MSLLGNLFRSSIGRKFLMAITGLVLVGFVIGHLIGNLQIFEHPDRINGYSAFLHQLGPLLWAARIVIIVSVVVHVWAATTLALENRRARGDQPGVKTWIRASLSSRAVRWTGYIVLAFLLYHIAHFTVGVAGADHFKDNLPTYNMTEDYRLAGFPVVRAETEVADIHSMVILGFQNPAISLFYIVAVGLLSFHLLHGVDSLFQTLGWRSGRWSSSLRVFARIFCVAYFLGNLLIPGAILIGAKGLREGYQGPVAHAVAAPR